MIGRAGLLNFPGWPDIELCWALDPQYWGNGYATEAAKCAAEWAFVDKKLNRLISLIDPNNKPSVALAERLNAVYSQSIVFWNKPIDVYELINNQF